MELHIQNLDVDGKEWLVATPQGDLDLAVADEFKLALQEALLKGHSRNLLLDLHKVTFIDSSGLGVILGRYRELQPLGGKIVIGGASEHVYKLLVASGLQRIITIDRPKTMPQVEEE